MITCASLGRAAFGVALLAFALAGPAAAQQPSPEQVSAIRSNCRADFQAKCAGVKAGGSEALACLKQNVAALSPGCQKAVGAIGGAAAPKSGEAAAAKPATAPAPAAEPAAAPAAPAAAAPPAAPAAAAAPPPAAAIPAAPAARVAGTMPAARPQVPLRIELAIMRQACGRDFQANCAGVRPGGGQVIACLAANQARLSPGCQRALAMAKGL
jgi:hypothetical protein